MRVVSCLGVLVVAIAMGCGGSAHSAGPTPVETSTSGSLSVDWTVNGTSDPNECTGASATAIEITVVTTARVPVGSFQQSCNAFVTNIPLEEGVYVADAKLLRVDGVALTRPIAIDEFTINTKSQLTIPVDFPTSAFIPFQ